MHKLEIELPNDLEVIRHDLKALYRTQTVKRSKWTNSRPSHYL